MGWEYEKSEDKPMAQMTFIAVFIHSLRKRNLLQNKLQLSIARLLKKNTRRKRRILYEHLEIKQPLLGAIYHIILRFITGDEICNYFTLIYISS